MNNIQNGRAIIDQDFNEIKVTIPAYKNWFLVFFLGFWLCGWAMGEFFVGAQIIRGNPTVGPHLFMCAWLAMWTLGGGVVIQYLIWMFLGKEIVTIDRQQMRIEKKAKIFFKPQVFEITACQQFRIFGKQVRHGKTGYRTIWPITFNFGLKTFDFATELDEPENRYILQMLVEKKWLKAAQIDGSATTTV